LVDGDFYSVQGAIFYPPCIRIFVFLPSRSNAQDEKPNVFNAVEWSRADAFYLSFEQSFKTCGIVRHKTERSETNFPLLVMAA
jgi:hypothetical protein